MRKERIIPLIVAAALFMENMDATVIATSLPAIAADIGTSPLTLKLAITSYLLALAVFIPASGWMADRFGARRVFTTAIVVFMLGSIGCALAQTIEHFVIARTIEGIGGAMMTPVGRLVLLRSIDKKQLVNAMAWVTAPALVGPVVGPALGGFITTYFSWHFIFLINIPIGILGIVMAQRYIDPIKSDDIQPFDFKGFVLAGLGLGGIAFGLSVAGLKILPWPAVIAFIVGGAICMTLYLLHYKRVPFPVLDFGLLRLRTMRAAIVGGFLFRLGIGALPFLLPLLLQVGFGLTPFQSGLITFGSAVGALFMKTLAARMINTFGFRNIMTVDAIVSAVFLAVCALFTPTTPLSLILVLLDRRRLLPLAAVHRDQHHRLRRSGHVAHEPGDDAGQRHPAARHFGRRRGRRVLGGADAVDAQGLRPGRLRLRPGLHRRRADLGVVGDRVRADAVGCRPPGVRP